MMENVLINFEDTGYSFLFRLELRSFEGHQVHFQSMGQAHTHTTFIGFSVQKTHWKSLTAGQSLQTKDGTSAAEVLSHLHQPSWS